MAHTIGVLRPRYVVMENVSAILVRGLDVVTGDLAALGYDVQWDCIPASAVGAPHQRDRWWGVAYPQSHRLDAAGRFADCDARNVGVGGQSQTLAHAESSRLEGCDHGNGDDCSPCVERTGELGGSGRRVASAVPHSPCRGWHERRLGHRTETSVVGQRVFEPTRGSGGPRNNGFWSAESDVCRVADGIPSRVDRLRALGNAVVPQVAEHVGRLLMDFEEERAA